MTEHVLVDRADRDGDGSGSSTRPHVLIRSVTFFATSAALAALVLVVLPALPRLLAMEAKTQFIQDSGIRAGAWFYTEVEQMPELESLVRDAVRDAGRTRGDAVAGVK